MIWREIGDSIIHMAEKMPVISICGPRQSGKTTLAKSLFPNYKYINFEDPELRFFAKSDPKSFLRTYAPPVILDEVQYAPELFSYIQLWVDESGKKGEFILTGSQNFLLMQNISQSLAGRVSIFTLLPLSLKELSNEGIDFTDAHSVLHNGFYPRLFDSDLKPNEWYPSYINTYIQRDVRQVLGVTDLHTFELFLKVCAGRAGQLLNHSAVANEIGVSHKTVHRWLSVLEASYIVFFLQPYHRNFNKRILKSPKIYFHDTGLLCSLLAIKNPADLQQHYLQGSIFENFIISELIKAKHNQVLNADFYFWRESNGNEIDLIIDFGNQLKIVEIKSAETLHASFLKQFKYWSDLSNNNHHEAYLIYRGQSEEHRSDAFILPWHKSYRVLEKLFQKPNS